MNNLPAEIWHRLLELLTLWHHWIDEGPEAISKSVLWGQPVYFWVRLGKALEFFAGCAIVADIIGPEKLRSYGTWLKAKNPARIFDRVQDSVRRRMNIVLFLIAFVALAFYLAAHTVHTGIFDHAPIWKQLLAGPLILVFSALLGALFVYLFLLDFVTAIVSIDMVVSLTAKIREKPDGDKWIKTASLLMLVAGFHFDLLAS